ncbi:MAG: hypothetical protein JWO30_3895 [Fibrobacteres bacterium]|nr:hypothetical protein [Fibrobacterota bacterium]
MTGTVKNKSTGLPVSQATLSLYDWNPATNKEFLFTSAKTDAQGNYKFDSLPRAGSGVVDVTRDGYKTFHQVILYPGSGNSVWDYDLQPATTAIGIGGGLAEASTFTWQPLPGGNILLRYPVLEKDASLRGYLPSGELVFQGILPARSMERVLTRGSGNRACYFTLQRK